MRADMQGPQDEVALVRRTKLADVLSVEICSRRAYGRHTHDEFGIGVILDGAQDSASGRGQVRAAKGQVITVNPNEVHDGIPLSGAPRHWRMLYFKPGIMASAFAGLEFAEGTELAYPVLEQPAARSAFVSLHAAVHEQGNCGLAAESLLIETLSHLVDPTGAGNKLRSPSVVTQAQQLLDDDPAAETSLSELAGLCGLSRFHFLRSFRAATGLPPHAYKLQRRLQFARRLIRVGTPIAQAAVDAGFADQAHLSRHFLRAYGYTCGNLARAR